MLHSITAGMGHTLPSAYQHFYCPSSIPLLLVWGTHFLLLINIFTVQAPFLYCWYGAHTFFSLSTFLLSKLHSITAGMGHILPSAYQHFYCPSSIPLLLVWGTHFLQLINIFTAQAPFHYCWHGAHTSFCLSTFLLSKLHSITAGMGHTLPSAYQHFYCPSSIPLLLVWSTHFLLLINIFTVQAPFHYCWYGAHTFFSLSTFLLPKLHSITAGMEHTLPSAYQHFYCPSSIPLLLVWGTHFLLLINIFTAQAPFHYCWYGAQASICLSTYTQFSLFCVNMDGPCIHSCIHPFFNFRCIDCFTSALCHDIVLAKHIYAYNHLCI